MKKYLFMKKIILVGLLVLFSESVFSAHGHELSKGLVNPGFYEKPDWFKQSFLDLQDDLDDANENNKRIMLYFHQDGCPYCKKLLEDNFSRQDIIEKMRQNYDLLEINMWGDKTITSMTGEELSEKEFARQMKIMFTPTLIILDKKGDPLFRMNGYYAPEKFLAVLDYLLPGAENKSSGLNQKLPTFSEFYKQRKLEKRETSTLNTASGLHTEKFIVKESDLQKLINTSNKPVMILFEQSNCADCDELHGDLFRRLPVYKKLRQFVIAQVDIHSSDKIIAPDGRKMTQKELAELLKIQYTPSILFYEHGSANKPVFRSEAYLKSFHLQAIFDYISTRAYVDEPEFQRFVQQRADKMRAEGIEFELWD